jgi:hypothetical protein
VTRDNSSADEGVARFHTTLWSMVLLSGQSTAPGSQDALGELCRLYWYPLYAFIRRRGYSPDDARDLTQGFFLHVLEHKTLTHVDPILAAMGAEETQIEASFCAAIETAKKQKSISLAASAEATYAAYRCRRKKF